MQIVVDINRCPQDHSCPCMKVCPVNAITQEGFNAPVIDYDKCIKCQKCVKCCPKGTFKIEQ